jgi:hypothetical protein
MRFGNHHLWWLGCSLGMAGLNMNQSAFPWMVDDGKTVTGNKGMTLRDYFAAKAMQGMLSGLLADGLDIQWSQIAQDSYRQADAMLERKNK